MTAERPIRLVLVGAGAWGQNLLRLALGSPRAHLVAVVDPDEQALARAAARAPLARGFRTLDQALALPLDAALIASPALTHAAAARACLGADLDVFVEKPFTSAVHEASSLVELARQRRRVAMVGHLLRYHPALRELLARLRAGAIGAPRSLLSSRLSPPGRPSDVSPLWALGAHDVSVLLAVDPSPTRSLSLFSPDAHRAELRAHLESGLSVHFSLSQIHPHKERRLCLVGDEGTLVFDDLRPDAPLVLRRSSRQITTERPLPVAPHEPLAVELDHFFDCVLARSEPLTPAEDGAAVVRWLAQAETASRRGKGDGPEAAPHTTGQIHRQT